MTSGVVVTTASTMGRGQTASLALRRGFPLRKMKIMTSTVRRAKRHSLARPPGDTEKPRPPAPTARDHQ
jgi:hypothetical protein